MCHCTLVYEFAIENRSTYLKKKQVGTRKFQKMESDLTFD